MKRVGIITFHASHNYGSMLQAYALQQTVIGLGCECEIINLRTKLQKRIYSPFFFKRDWKQIAKAFIYPKLAIGEWRKHVKFETFLNQNYRLTECEYSSSEQLRFNPPLFDYYISGSDQIWNTACYDFEKAYYLDFVRFGKRIAYAASMGPRSEEDIKAEFNDFISNSVNRYDSISVREAGTVERLKYLAGVTPPIVLDPTFLVDRAKWNELSGEHQRVGGQYILLYSPGYNETVYAQASELSKATGLKVVCTLSYARKKWGGSNFKFVNDIGPIEFLNLIRNAALVISGSFHALVFSLIFNRPVYAVNGMRDSRISHILKLTGMESLAEYPKALPSNCDYALAWRKLDSEIKMSKDFLKKSLDL